MSDFAELMATYAAEMTIALRRTRATLEHNLSKGEALEEAVRRFLSGQLPESLAVTKGEVVDRFGNHSGQLDVIIYDRQRTPVFFVSAEDGRRVLPAEGVLAVVEVKTGLRPSGLESIVRHMQKVKRLEKTSYFDMPITYRTTVHGDDREVFPILYFVLGFEGGSWVDLANQLNHLQAQLPIDKRVDNAVCLDPSYVILNVDMGPVGEARPVQDWRYSATPSAQAAAVVGFEQKDALGMWYLAILSQLSSWPTPPIDLRPYMQAATNSA